MSVALAAPHRDAVAAGERAIAAGGNALDAALAAAAMLTVVYPHQCAIGGDLIALVRAPSGDTTAVVAAGTAPAAISEVARSWTSAPRAGAHSVTVPGMLAGWLAIAALGAARPIAAALSDAAETAAAGAPVSAGLARALTSRREAVLADDGMRGVFAPDGAILGEGDPLRQPALAATLRRLQADPGDLYRGETARSIVSTLRAHGGVHTEADFAGYEPEVRPALSTSSAGRTWTVAPPPSAGALLLGVVAASAGGAEADVLSASVRGVHARALHLGDPRAAEVDLAAMLDLREHASAPGREPRPCGDTAAVVAIDDDGWGVTIVQSVYQTFGAGLLDARTGILLHNRGSAFGVDPSLPSMIRPGARPPHTLTPAIVEQGSVMVIAGCQGGRAQPWILAQLLPEATDAAVPLDELLRRPRWVVGDRDLGRDRLTLVAEPGVAEGVLERAARDGLAVAAFDGPADEAGHVQLVRRDAAGAAGRALDAASDPRADGAGVVRGGGAASIVGPGSQEGRRRQ